MTTASSAASDRYAERMLPRDVDAERSLLGAMLLSGESMVEAAAVVPAEAFSAPRHAVIWEAFLRTTQAGSPADVALVQSALIAMGELESIGGMGTLIELAEIVPAAVNWRWYARCVLLAHRRRLLIEAADNAKRTAYDGGDVDAAIDTLSAELGALQSIERRRPEPVGKVLPRVLDEIFSEEPTGIATGLRELDATMQPMRPGQQIIIGATTGMGKSSLAMTIALRIADSGGAALFVSCEMRTEELTRRLIAARTGLSTSRLERPSSADAKAIAAASGSIDALPLSLHYAPGIALTQLAGDVKTWAGKHPGGLVVVDYLQLVRDPGHRSRETEVAAVSRGLKALAGEAGVIMLACSQLNREVNHRASALPTLSDLRDSGAIEQDADVVLLLHREDALRWKDPDYVCNGQAKVLVAKQRNGATGLALLRWDACRMLFLSGGSARPTAAPKQVELGEIPV